MSMTPHEQELVIRKLRMGLEYQVKANSLDNGQISKMTGYSKNAIKKICGRDGKDHPGYHIVMPFIKERDRYRSKSAELTPERVARSMGHPEQEVLGLYEVLREINFKFLDKP